MEIETDMDSFLMLRSAGPTDAQRDSPNTEMTKIRIPVMGNSVQFIPECAEKCFGELLQVDADNEDVEVTRYERDALELTPLRWMSAL